MVETGILIGVIVTYAVSGFVGLYAIAEVENTDIQDIYDQVDKRVVRQYSVRVYSALRGFEVVSGMSRTCDVALTMSAKSGRSTAATGSMNWRRQLKAR